MQYVIGTDEAGYGPNLGPLVVSATVWQVPDGVRAEDLYGRLAEVIVRRPKEVAQKPAARVAMADSKTLYKPGTGLRHLERGLWAALSLLGRRPKTWTDVWTAMAPASADGLQAIWWYAGYDTPAPLDADPAELEPLAAALGEGLAAAGIRLVELQSRAVFPERFNQLLRQHGSKSTALSHQTLDLVARVMEPLAETPQHGSISIICDKHGGRNRYAQLLCEHFPDRLIEVYGEGRTRSIYRFGPPQHRVQFCFQTKAESYLPPALASMASKYLRELAMRAFNSYWCDRLPNLRPTAGYPQDARRFRNDIAVVQAALGIEDNLLWRTK